MFGLDALKGEFVLDKVSIGQRIVVKVLSVREELFVPKSPLERVTAPKTEAHIRWVLELYLPEYKRIVTFTPFSLTSARASAHISSYPFGIDAGYFQLVATEWTNRKYRWYTPTPEKLPETKRNASWLLMAETILQDLIRKPKKLMEFDFSDTAVELEKLEAEKAALHADYRKKSVSLNRKIRELKGK